MHDRAFCQIEHQSNIDHTHLAPRRGLPVDMDTALPGSATEHEGGQGPTGEQQPPQHQRQGQQQEQSPSPTRRETRGETSEDERAWKRRWPAGRLAHVEAGATIDLDGPTASRRVANIPPLAPAELLCRYPPRCFIHKVTDNSRYRCIHRRPFSAQVEDGMLVCRDVHVFGPWRGDKTDAERDRTAFRAAYDTGEPALQEAVRLAHGHDRSSHGLVLRAWELEVELRGGAGAGRGGAARLARGVLRGRGFTVQGQWFEGRTKAEEDLMELMRRYWKGTLIGVAAPLAGPAPRHSPQTSMV